jgi:hypothetical protein
LKPKSVAREIVESLQPFGGYVKEYGLARSEGLLLRYLSEVYKTLLQTIPELARTAELDEATAYLGALVRGVDSSLLDEWQRLQHPDRTLAGAPDAAEDEHAEGVVRDRKAFTALVRNVMFSLVRSLAARDYESFLDGGEPGAVSLTPLEVEHALYPLFESGASIQVDANARNPRHTVIEERDDFWHVSQALLVEDEVSEFSVRGRIDLTRSLRDERPIFLLDHVGEG